LFHSDGAAQCGSAVATSEIAVEQLDRASDTVFGADPAAEVCRP
jgi:hypothetical protein